MATASARAQSTARWTRSWPSWLMQYFGHLRGDPDAAPDADYSGYQFWLSKLGQFHGNYINAEMVKAFLSSIEYRRRFAWDFYPSYHFAETLNQSLVRQAKG